MNDKSSIMTYFLKPEEGENIICTGGSQRKEYIELCK